MSMIHVVSTSGGADSAATALLQAERFGITRAQLVFADTGNEHEITLAYLDYLSQFLGIPILRLRADFSEQIANKRKFIEQDQRADGWTDAAKARALAILQPTGNPFLDLCLWKGRFPSRKAQFCTQELKRDIIVAHQLDLIDAGHTVVSWQGVRRDESANRRDAKRFERLAPHFYAYRPLVEWSKDQVFEYCAKRGLEPNPLYRQGMGRVGCMPCINVVKEELRQIAARFPEHIDRIEAWESLVSQASKHGYSTFFHKVNNHEGTVEEIYSRERVREAVQWAKTTRGGRHLDVFAEAINPMACESQYAGLCE